MEIKERLIDKENQRLTLGDIHLAAEEKTLRSDYRIHWHSYFELEIVISGEAEHTLNDEKYEISRGSAYILNPADFHGMKPKKQVRLWNISFDEALLSDQRLCELSRIDGDRRYTLTESQLNSVISLAALIRDEAKYEGGGCSRELCESLITILMRGSEKAHKETENASAIRRALLYLDLHFRENPSLAKVAAHAGFHPNYFSNLFKRVTGESFVDRLNSLRVGYAKMLLSKGFSVTEACYNSGFGSLSNFLTVFKKKTGVCPEKYKKI